MSGLDELKAAIDEATRCSDPGLREEALMCLGEEAVQAAAHVADRMLTACDDGEIALSDAARAELLEAIELAVGRPDWYTPGDRVVLSQEAARAGEESL